MRLPDVQAALRKLRERVDKKVARRLSYLANQIYRRKSKPNKPRVKTIKFSKAEGRWVKQQRYVNRLTYDEIELAFEKKYGRLTNVGRISECLRGKRK